MTSFSISSILNSDDVPDDKTVTSSTQSSEEDPTLAAETHEPVKNDLLRNRPAFLQPWDELPTDEVFRKFYSDEFPAQIREVVTYYFDYYYSICPIFHPASFLCRLVSGKIDPILIDVMRARTARVISKHTGRKIDVDAIIEGINKQLLVDMEHLTVDSMRAIVLMTTLSGGECRFMSFNSLASLVSSMVGKLGWNVVDLRDYDKSSMMWHDWVNLEGKRRLFWIVYQLDAYQALLCDRPMSISNSRIYTTLPRSDHTWDDINLSRVAIWPVDCPTNETGDEAVQNGSLSYALSSIVTLASYYSQLNDLLWDIKRMARYSDAANNCTIDIVGMRHKSAKLVIKESLFEYPPFVAMHQKFVEWKKSLVLADQLKGLGQQFTHFTQFGSLKHRQFMLRMRLFCLYCYYVPSMLFLHLANRPSFFQQEPRVKPVGKDADKSDIHLFLGPGYTDNTQLIREILSTSFSTTINDSLLAEDVCQQSWDICLESIDDMYAFIERNDDVPVERYDQIMQISFFTSITVLIRHVCSKRVRDGVQSDYRFDIAWSVRIMRGLWERLKKLGYVSGVAGMEALLQKMHVDQVVATGELFAKMAL
ncbi:hypothetical protein FB645_001525 [Coemansia sp. IMI 203386]|nr:hypothetical protein FB645_001525 [Coemansia sp. IMI 203386]